jgi:hypothetical protein
MAFHHVLVFLLVSFIRLCLLGLWSLCWPHPGPVQSRAAAKMRTTLHRLRHRHAPHWTVPPVASPAPTHLLRDQHRRRYDLGVR